MHYLLQFYSINALRMTILALWWITSWIGGCGTFTSAPPTCPKDNATFRCSVLSTSMDDVTQWTMKINETIFICFLSHRTGADVSDMCGRFRAQREMITDSCFSSSLTVVATSDINEAFIRCVSNGNGSLKVLGRLSTLYIIILCG